jgi:glycerol kinase
VFVGGAVVQWLRDGLRAISSSSEVQRWPSVPDSGRRDDGARLHRPGRPYWKPDARGTITGLTRGTTLAHIARAALESIAYQSAALLLAMSRDAVAAGGAGERAARGRRRLRQRPADAVPGRPAGHSVVRPAVVETTALGAAYLAGLSSGVYGSTDELSRLWRPSAASCPRCQPTRPRS